MSAMVNVSRACVTPAWFVAALLSATLAAGCSRLAGEHRADAAEADDDRFEQMFDDAPESLKRKSNDPSDDEDRSGQPARSVSSNVVADSPKRAAREPASVTSTVARPPVRPAPMRPTQASPRAQLRGKKPIPQPPRDEIPDAAEIGL